jgi:hypothetical protein
MSNEGAEQRAMSSEEGRMKNGVFVEESILNSVKKLLLGRVNELLGEVEYPIRPIECGGYRGGSVVVGACSPVIALSTCECSEKERIIRVDAYTLTIAFAVPEHPDGERNCYAYAAAVGTVLNENPTLGGIAGRAVLTGKKYVPPKHSGTGGDWQLVLSLRITAENPHPCGFSA